MAARVVVSDGLPSPRQPGIKRGLVATVAAENSGLVVADALIAVIIKNIDENRWRLRGARSSIGRFDSQSA